MDYRIQKKVEDLLLLRDDLKGMRLDENDRKNLERAIAISIEAFTAIDASHTALQSLRNTGFNESKDAIEAAGSRVNHVMILLAHDFDSPEKDRYTVLKELMQDAFEGFERLDTASFLWLSPADRRKYKHNEEMCGLGINPKVKDYLNMSWSEVKAVIANMEFKPDDSQETRMLKRALMEMKFASVA